MFATYIAKPTHEVFSILVSIPFRGFRCLQRWGQEFLKLRSVLFQSLSGVLDVCNERPPQRAGMKLYVSIPFRGFRCLQRTSYSTIPRSLWVFQSLSGVLDVCNIGERIGWSEGKISFNPFQGF